MWPPFTTVIFLSCVCTHGGDRCLSCCLYCNFLSSLVKQTKRILTHSVQLLLEREGLSSVKQNMSRQDKPSESLRKKKKIPMYFYAFRETSAQCHVKVVEFKTARHLILAHYPRLNDTVVQWQEYNSHYSVF